MKAMILTAGLGTRLRPLTLERAKPAIPLLGIPLVVHVMQRLMEEGVSAFRLNLHYLPQTIEQIFAAGHPLNAMISFSYEQRILGTAGGLAANESFFDDGTFLLANGDIVADFSLREALAFHRERKPLATLLLYRQEPPFLYYPIRIDRELRIRNFKGEAQGGILEPDVYVFTGIHILEPEIFRYIPAEQPSSITDHAYLAALQEGAEICGYPVQGYWNDIGTPQRYLQAQRDLFLRAESPPFVTLASNVLISDTAVVGPFVSVASRCEIGEQSHIQEAIFWEDVRVRQSSQLQHCIVGSDMTIQGNYCNRVISRHGETSIV